MKQMLGVSLALDVATHEVGQVAAEPVADLTKAGNLPLMAGAPTMEAERLSVLRHGAPLPQGANDPEERLGR